MSPRHVSRPELRHPVDVAGRRSGHAMRSGWIGLVFRLSDPDGRNRQVTPPVGFNLYVIQGISGMSLNAVSYATLPFVILLLFSADHHHCVPRNSSVVAEARLFWELRAGIVLFECGAPQPAEFHIHSRSPLEGHMTLRTANAVSWIELPPSITDLRLSRRYRWYSG